MANAEHGIDPNMIEAAEIEVFEDAAAATQTSTDDDLALKQQTSEYGSGIAYTVAQRYPEIDPATVRSICEGAYLDGLRAARKQASR